MLPTVPNFRRRQPGIGWVIPTNEELMIAQHTRALIFPLIEAGAS